MKMSEKKAEEAVEIERAYKLREFKDRDLFPLLNILKKVGLKQFKAPFVQVATGEKSAKDIGVLIAIDMADVLVSGIGQAEDEIYSFYAELSGIPAEEIKEMEFGTLPMMIYDSFNGVKELSFFKVLFKSL